MSVWGYAHLSAGAHTGRGSQISQQAELLRIVSSPKWVLGTKPSSFGSVVLALNR